MVHKPGRTATNRECRGCECATMGCMAETYPLQILIASVAGWVNRQQGDVLAFLVVENRRQWVRSVLLPEVGGPNNRYTRRAACEPPDG